MSGDVPAISSRLPVGRTIANALRRRLWRLLFARHQNRMGSFFLDPRDHIGAERLITGDRYEGQLLALLGMVIDRLGLGEGTALDAGANIGNHACFFAPRFRHVICVEPGRVAALVLEANLDAAGFRNFEIHRFALGKDAGAGVLDRISDDNLGSSVVRKVDGEGEFRIVSGDQLWRQTGASDLQLIKIDVEGAEVDVIEGIACTLATEKPLVCVEVLEEQRWNLVRQLLVAAGYGAWFVVVPAVDARSLLGRIWSTLRGRRYDLTPLSTTFRSGGYEMILCMTSSHVARLAH